MAYGGVIGAAARRPGWGRSPERAAAQALVPHVDARAWFRPRPSAFPEIDCVRDLLPGGIIAAAERRAKAIGLGADRVLISADAITEEAYLRALAASLGTSYTPLDGVSRADCPLDDDRLIQAASTGLLPLRHGDRIVWIIAPRRLGARYLADTRQPLPASLHSFQLTSSEQLLGFVARHGRTALGRQAADGLRRSQPLFSNAPQPGVWKTVTVTAFLTIGISALALVPAASITAFAALLCALFLAAAALRLLSALCTRQRLKQRIRVR